MEHACIQSHTAHTYSHYTLIHTLVHTHTHAHTHTHTHTRAHTHTRMLTHTMLHSILYTHLLLCLRPARTHSTHSVAHWQLTTCVGTEKTKDPPPQKRSNLRLRKALGDNNQATQVHTLQSHYLPLPSPTTACSTLN